MATETPRPPHATPHRLRHSLVQAPRIGIDPLRALSQTDATAFAGMVLVNAQKTSPSRPVFTPRYRGRQTSEMLQITWLSSANVGPCQSGPERRHPRLR